MVSRWGATFLINRKGGTQDSETGVFTPDDGTEIYNGNVNYEEGISRNHALRIENNMGLDIAQIHGTIFLEETWKLKDIKLEDKGVITFKDTNETLRVEVLGIRRIDSVLFVKKAS